MTWREAWAAKGLTPAQSGVYRYRDESGEICVEKLRWALYTEDGATAGKTFTVRHRPRPASEPFRWAPGIGPYSRLLYRLPELLSALRDGTDVWFTEGEKDADNAAKAWGIVTTSHHTGAAAASPTQLKPFVGFKGNVFFVLDADPTGWYVAYENARRLAAVGLSKDRIWFLTGGLRSAKADISDHIVAGLGLGDLRQVDQKALKAQWQKMRKSDAVGSRAFGSEIGVTFKESNER